VRLAIFFAPPAFFNPPAFFARPAFFTPPAFFAAPAFFFPPPARVVVFAAALPRRAGVPALFRAPFLLAVRAPAVLRRPALPAAAAVRFCPLRVALFFAIASLFSPLVPRQPASGAG
jgi:hypothetical protein